MHTLESMQVIYVVVIEGGRKNMSKPTSATKRKYNKGAYRRYEFSVKVDTKLNHLIEQYKNNGETSLSELIKNLLCQHFEVEAEDIYVSCHIRRINGQWTRVQNEL